MISISSSVALLIMEMCIRDSYVTQDDQKAIQYLSQSQQKEAYLYKGILLEKQREYSEAFQSYLLGAKHFQKECMYKVGLLLK